MSEHATGWAILTPLGIDLHVERTREKAIDRLVGRGLRGQKRRCEWNWWKRGGYRCVRVYLTTIEGNG